jgi:NAD(P)-dependent dehydrogenase (short-subunit alcohol dehydrogenase family)
MGSKRRGRYQMRSYQTAKLAVTTWIYGLARRWAGRGISANVLDPGLVKGKSGSEHFEGSALTGILMCHVIPFFVAAGMARGSQQYVRLAADPALADASGRYFVRARKRSRQAPRSPSTPPPTSASTMRPRHGPNHSCTAGD